MYKITSKKARKLKSRDRSIKFNSKMTNFERDWKQNYIKKKLLKEQYFREDLEFKKF